VTPRQLDRARIRLAERIAPAGYVVVAESAVLDMIEAGLRERDAAHQAAYDTGFLDGLESGLRELLDDAATALGRAA
jgi:hypothetical protein